MLPMVIMISVFVGVTTLVMGVAMLMRGEVRSIAETRLDVLTGVSSVGVSSVAQSGSIADSLREVRDPIGEYIAKYFNLERFISQSGVDTSASKVVMISGVLGAAVTMIAIIFRPPWGIAPACGLCAASLPLMYIWWRRKSRLAKFGSQLPETLELVSRALRAGHSLAAGFNLVAEEMNEPIKSEFARVYEAQNLGIPLEQALEEMADRVPNLDLRFFVTAVVLQRQTGGDLAEILDKIGHLVRERFKIWGQIQALTGEGRLSGVVLLALPPVLFVVMYRLNPQYSLVLFTDPMGQKMLAAAVIMQILGALTIRQIVKIEV